jgi:hypothetical protein
VRSAVDMRGGGAAAIGAGERRGKCSGNDKVVSEAMPGMLSGDGRHHFITDFTIGPGL